MKYWRDEYLEHLTEDDPPGGSTITSEKPDEKSKIQKVIDNFIKDNKNINIIIVFNNENMEIIESIYNISGNKLSTNFENRKNIFKGVETKATSDRTGGNKITDILNSSFGATICPTEYPVEFTTITNPPTTKYAVGIIIDDNKWNQFCKNNNIKMEKTTWLYADGEVSKKWGKNWGSEVMAKVGNILGSGSGKVNTWQ